MVTQEEFVLAAGSVFGAGAEEKGCIFVLAHLSPGCATHPGAKPMLQQLFCCSSPAAPCGWCPMGCLHPPCISLSPAVWPGEQPLLHKGDSGTSLRGSLVHAGAAPARPAAMSCHQHLPLILSPPPCLPMSPQAQAWRDVATSQACVQNCPCLFPSPLSFSRCPHCFSGCGTGPALAPQGFWEPAPAGTDTWGTAGTI